MFSTAAPTLLSVIDPCNRTGKIEIPMTYVTETKGVADYLRYAQNPPPDAKDLSLCLLFQRGRCNAGSRCNQVHASADYVEVLRTRVAATKSCCAAHGDVHSASLDGRTTVAVMSDDSEPQHFNLRDFAQTAALDIALRRGRDATFARVQGSRICRLHQRGSCKFGRDCKNIHLCPNAQPTAAAAVKVAPRRDERVVPALGMAFRAISQAPSLPSSASVASNDMSTRCCAAPAPNADTSMSSNSSFHHPAAPLSDRSISKASTASECDAHLELASLLRPLNVSMLSGTDEFNSIRARGFGCDMDPLDILDDGFDSSDVSATDFDAFVDALVDCGPETLASPQWIVA